ncbi:MAG: hypothetical protein AB2A00_22055 [Myxococcota bacterium]
MMPALLLLMLAAANVERAAVLTVTVSPSTPESEAVAELMTNTLTDHLARLKVYDVMAPHEVQALLANEQERQMMGCEADTCLAELAGALGVRFLVVGRVERVQDHHLWTARIVDQTAGTVVSAGAMKAATLASLVAQVEDMARVLCHLEPITDDDQRAARRWGFVDVRDARDFRTYRLTVPELSTGEALTRYIVRHNAESNALAVAEAATVLTGSMLLAASFAGTIFAALAMLSDATTVSLLSLGGAGVMFHLGVAAMAAALVLLVVDALDLGRVPVRDSGCCVDARTVADVEADDGVTRSSALAMLLAGPLTVAVGLTLVMTGAVVIRTYNISGGAQRFRLPSDGNDTVWTLSAFTGLFAFPLLPVALCLPLVVATPTGLWQLFSPQKPLRDAADDEEAAP